MMYKIEYIKLTTTWIKEDTKEAVSTCLKNVFDICSEHEFTKQNFIDVLTAYFKRNPFTNKEICEFIKYLEIDIDVLIGEETSMEILTNQMVNDIYRDLIVDTIIYLS